MAFATAWSSAAAAVRFARSSRSGAPSPAAMPGSPEFGADSRRAARWPPRSNGTREYGLHKVSPLLDWSEKDIWDYIRKKRLPYNTLHDHRFSQHRLRTVHARGAAGRGCALGALVVGTRRLARVRLASAAPDSRVRAEPAPSRSSHRSAATRTYRLNYFPVFFDLKGKRCSSSAAARWRCAK